MREFALKSIGESYDDAEMIDGLAASVVESAIAWRHDGAPVPVRVALAVMAPLGLWTGLADLRAMLRLRRARR